MPLYLTTQLNYDETSSIFVFHVFTMLVYFFPLMGAIVADSWLGKYRTILYLSMVYALGGVFIAMGAIPVIHVPVQFFTMLGLGLIAVGTGGIKPCVSAFGGDQFKLPDQMKQFAMFFSLFYAAINAGSLISTLLTPILRESVACFGEDTCYSLAFGVPAVLMVVSILIFVGGRSLYVMQPTSGRLSQVFKCIASGVTKRLKWGSTNPQEHWLDYAEPKYGKQLVQEIKALLRILVLYIPLPMFWALFDQQGSRWTFQATRLDPRIFGLQIQPDQLQFLNPLMIIMFIPIFKYTVYPLLERVRISRPLQKMILGGFLIMFSFVVAAYIENEQFIEELAPRMPEPGQHGLVLINGYPCDYSSTMRNTNDTPVDIPMYSKYSQTLFAPDEQAMQMDWVPLSNSSQCKPIAFSIFNVTKGDINTYLVRPNYENATARQAAVVEKLVTVDYKRSKDLTPLLSLVLANRTAVEGLTISGPQNYSQPFNFTDGRMISNIPLPYAGNYTVSMNGTVIATESLNFAETSMVIVGVNQLNKTVRERALSFTLG